MSLSVSIKKKFKGFSLDVNFETDGEYVGILGASGSGKSMTLKCIAGIETPDEGRIVLNGRVLFDSEAKINLRPQDRRIGYLFQNYALFPNMTVKENIGAGLKLSKKERDTKISEMIIKFHLEGMENKYPSQLSGGQQQRVALARIFAYEPDVLLLDEPFSALDTHLKEKLQTEILDFLQLYEGDVLMVTHSRDEVYKFCKNLVIVDHGKSILYGNTKDIFEHPRLLAVARLTGCKNISQCQVISSHSIYSSDWDVLLELERKVPEHTKYVGIRAHNIHLAEKNDLRNTIKCKVTKIVEDLFEYTIIAETVNKNDSADRPKIWFMVKKDKLAIDLEEILYLKIPDKAILLLE